MPPIAKAPRRGQVLMHERGGHGDLRAVGHNELLFAGELLDVTEDVVPAPAIEAGAVLAQFIEDFVHLESGQDMLDEHRRFDAALGNFQEFLGAHEDVVPQAGFQKVLELWEIEIDARAMVQAVADVVKEVEGEIEEAGGNGLAASSISPS